MSKEVKSERVRRKQRRRKIRSFIRNFIILLVLAGLVVGIPFLTNRSIGSYARSAISWGRNAVKFVSENVHP